ncbi:hypothetical protein OSB04_015608 [Centaurea solstitialis]|uniref:NB-ARC domain-containing protein n=1 Tax=Centaurea solstitialis TaxID=347529 RepID=A0AA38SZI9_9ASTR|nr:hypothetical protein OSB04_015608 [Centaurea solstitialis]
MAYTAALQILIDNLKKLIHGTHDPVINNNSLILSKRPQFQLLYQELNSIIQTLFSIHHLHEFEKVRNLKKRFKDAAEEAEDSIDIFLSALHFGNRGVFSGSDVLKTSLDLDKVLKSIESIKVELMTINIGNMKMDSSSRISHVKRQSVAAGTSYTRNPLRIMKPSEEIVVGHDRDAEIIRDKLTEDTKQLSIISIVGMGGLGKTTLATKLFNDPFLKYHFHIRAWATVSQTYIKRDFLIQILTSVGVQQSLDEASDSQLREMLHKKLMGRKYLIVIDDIWSVEAWSELKMFFSHDNTGSRILLTTRLNEVAVHVKQHGFVHSLPCLTEEESWELLKQKVFHGDECPEWLIEPGRHIARKCQGLPLSVVVMAGVLAKEPMSKDLWEEIACSISSYQKGNLETLALSYHHLPDHLRECFLYLGGFPEDFKFNVERLIWLWVAEGFIEEAENRKLEDTAKAYLTDLINRNLVVVVKRNVIGDVESCELHDLVRELCVQEAKKERFFLKIDSLSLSSQLHPDILYQQRRLFTNADMTVVNFTLFPARSIRSFFCFQYNIYSFTVTPCSFLLLKVLDLQKGGMHCFPVGIALLVHLRYLSIWYSSGVTKSICKLWSLQTLILHKYFGPVYLPREIQDLLNLRHLWCNKTIQLPYIGKLMNLQSISYVKLEGGVDNLQKCFPIIKKLHLYGSEGEQYHFELLPYLETLKLTGSGSSRNHIWFPATLKKLTLTSCCLPWSDMSSIQSLPNLEVLKLKSHAFVGAHWDACEQQFRQLKFLLFYGLNVKQWEASSTSFPCLKRFSLEECEDLEEIPLEIGEIATLELIEINTLCYDSIVESAVRIQQEQQDVGNDELEITINGKPLSHFFEDDISEYQWEASSTSFPCLKRLSLRTCEDLEEIPLEVGEIATFELIEIDNLSNRVVESVKRIQQEQHDVGNDEMKITISGMDLSLYLSRGLPPRSDIVSNSYLNLENAMRSIQQMRFLGAP